MESLRHGARSLIICGAVGLIYFPTSGCTQNVAITPKASRSVKNTDGTENFGSKSSSDDEIATDFALKASLLTMAMNLGERCEAISKEDDNKLMRAWLKIGTEVADKYSESIRLKYIVRERASEAEAEKLPCSDAHQTISVAMKAAQNITAR